jgi:hypothetical protein
MVEGLRREQRHHKIQRRRCQHTVAEPSQEWMNEAAHLTKATT